MLRPFRLLAVLVLSAAPASAQPLVFDDGGTHLVDTPVVGKDGSVRSEDGPGGAPTTVTVTTSVSGGVHSKEHSHAILDGATTGNSVFALDEGTLVVLNSMCGNDVYGNDMADVSIHDSTVANTLFTNGEAVIDVSMTDVGSDLFANGAGHITIHTASTIAKNVFTNSMGTIVIEDAEIAGWLWAQGMSLIELRGGTVAEELESRGTSVLEIYGTAFEVDGAPVPYGELAATSGTLTGLLGDGSPLDNLFDREVDAKIVLIPAPEPAAALLAIFGTGVMFAMRSLTRPRSSDSPRPCPGTPGDPNTRRTRRV